MKFKSLILPIGAVSGWGLSKIVPKNTHWSFKPDYRCIVHNVDSSIGCFPNTSTIAKVKQNEKLLPTVFKDSNGKFYWLDTQDIKDKENVDESIKSIRNKFGSILADSLEKKESVSLKIHNSSNS